MFSRFKPPERRAIFFIGSIWLAAIAFLLARSLAAF
jgi:hypothetical protein